MNMEQRLKNHLIHSMIEKLVMMIDDARWNISNLDVFADEDGQLENEGMQMTADECLKQSEVLLDDLHQVVRIEEVGALEGYWNLYRADKIEEFRDKLRVLETGTRDADIHAQWGIL